MTGVHYNNQFSGTNPYYWWLGQIVDEVNWGGNGNPKIHDRDDVPGWGFRYKVRIFGRDTKTKETPDDVLEMAEVLLPVTAGGGHAGSTQTANLRQGAYVVGFYKDGIDAREPVITGVLPNNSQTKLFGGDPELGFVPRSGYIGKTGQKPVSTKNIYTAGPSSPVQEESSNPGPIRTVQLPDQYKDGTRCHYVPKTRACDGSGGELKGVQKFIKDALAFINRIKAEANGFLGAASDLTAGISQVVNDISIAISGLMKTLLDRMRGYIVTKLNNGIKDLIEFLPPNQRPGLNQANETATDTLQCVFNKIIRGLVGLVKGLLEQIIDKFVNAPLCAIENFIGSLIGSVLGDITGAIQSALSAVSSILGKVGNIVGSIFDVFDFVSGILNFLSCEEQLDCTMGDEWSFWGGAKCATANASAGIKSASDSIKKWIEGDGGGGGGGVPCNTAQIPCGPPTVSISGGGGSGALGNPIISATGAILGIDFVNGGSGYTSAPNIQLTDSCGIGNGAVVIPIISSTEDEITSGETVVSENGTIVTIGDQNNPDFSIGGGTGTTGGTGTGTGTAGGTGTGTGTGTAGGAGTGAAGGGTGTGGTGTAGGGTGTGGSLIGVVVVDPGSGYLTSPNGSTGGNGSVFSKIDDTVVFNNDGYSVYPPGSTISVSNGDTIYGPPGTKIDIFDSDGNITETITGQGGTVPIIINNSGSLTTPTYQRDQTYQVIDPSSQGSYPIVLSIGDVAILNGGVNYDPNDKIVVSPDNGAKLEPIFNDVGRLTDVKVVNSGIGFTEFPRVFIESQLGINAVLVPVFKILRVGDLPEDQDIVPLGTPIISVVDCVGKVS